MNIFDYCESRCILATGPDAVRFLNGQLTQNITSLTSEDSVYSFVCDAKGKIQFHLEVSQTEQQLTLRSEAAAIEELLARLDRFLIADDCDLQLTEAVQAPRQNTTARILAKSPLLQDLVGRFPAETSLLDKAVSFSKGCYQGQEVISRMKRAGKTNQRLIGGTLNKAPTESPQNLLHPESGKNQLTLTSITSEPVNGEFPFLGYLQKRAEGHQELTDASGLVAKIT